MSEKPVSDASGGSSSSSSIGGDDGSGGNRGGESNDGKSSNNASGERPTPFRASVDRYICLALDGESTALLADAVKHLPGTPIKSLHVTIVHSLDAAKSDEAMQLWNRALKLLGQQEVVGVKRYKSAPGTLTAAEALLHVDLAALVASKVPHISLRLEKGHKAVESRFVLRDNAIPWSELPAPISVRGVIKLMEQQKKEKK
jgi:hypothetical protein